MLARFWQGYFGQMFHSYPIIGTYCQLLDGRPIIANYWFPFFHGKQAGRRTKRNMCTNTQKPNPPRPPGTSCCPTIPFSPSRPNLISKTVPETCTKSRDHLVKIQQHEIKNNSPYFLPYMKCPTKTNNVLDGQSRRDRYNFGRCVQHVSISR